MSLLVIISSPSGGGKDSVINALLKRIPSSTRLVTTTTRAPRPGNKEGVDYYFISVEEFKKRLEANAFLEHNIYAGNYYGEERAELEKCFTTHQVVFSQVDVTGKHALDRQKFPHVSIFLVPENMEVLRKRIEKRGGITPETITERLEIAEKEITESADYDYKILNAEGKLEETIEKIAKIIEKHLTLMGGIDKNSKLS